MRLAAEHCTVHGLVADAGVTWRARLDEVTGADLLRAHVVDVVGTPLGLPALTRLITGGGSIVVLGSVAARTGTPRSPARRRRGHCAASPGPRPPSWAHAGPGQRRAPALRGDLDDSVGVTGAETAVDGGLTAHGGVESIADLTR